MLINPSMLDDERHKKNVELKKKKGGYRPYEEDVDEFGQPKKQQILAKYAEDEEESQKRETFRLGMGFCLLRCEVSFFKMPPCRFLVGSSNGLL